MADSRRRMTLLAGSDVEDRGRGDGRLTQALAALLLVIFLACLVLWGFTGLRTVPDVVGMTMAQAKATLEEAGFAVDAEEVATGVGGEDDKVLEQAPRAGNRVLAGSTVTLQVAQAAGTTTGESGSGGAGGAGEGIALPEWAGNPPREDTVVPYDADGLPGGVRVPSVMGMSQSAALAALSSAGLRGSVQHARSTTNVPVGAVVAQKPSAESYQPPGTTVVIYLSTGPPPAGVPYQKAPYN